MTLYNETMARKTITINEDTHKELVKLGVYGESMDGIIRKLIDCYKDNNKNEEKELSKDFTREEFEEYCDHVLNLYGIKNMIPRDFKPDEKEIEKLMKKWKEDLATEKDEKSKK